MRSILTILLILIVGVSSANPKNLSKKERKQQEIANAIDILETGEFKIKRHSGARNELIYPRLQPYKRIVTKPGYSPFLFEIKSGKEHLVLQPYGNDPNKFTMLIKDFYRYTGVNIMYAILTLDLKSGMLELECRDKLDLRYTLYRTHCTMIQELEK